MAAVLLIMAASDRSTPRGDIVLAAAPKHEWGKEEAPPVYRKLLVTDAESGDLMHLRERGNSGARKWWIDLDKLVGDEVTMDELRPHIRRKLVA